MIAIAVSGILLAAAAGVVLLATNGSRAQAQTPPAPCACSRSTPIVGADEVSAVPGQLQPRFGIIALPVRRRHVREPGSLRLGRDCPSSSASSSGNPGAGIRGLRSIRGPTSNGDPSWPSQPCARQSKYVPLTKEQFRERFFAKFYDPAFDKVRPELEKVFEVAWDGYISLPQVAAHAAGGEGLRRSEVPAVRRVVGNAREARGGREAPEEPALAARAS